MNGEPAVLRHDSVPWFHVTHPKNLDSIRSKGLNPEPAQRTYTGYYTSIGGIYVVSDRLPQVVRYIQLEYGTAGVAVLQLRLRAGTRFCLDEDEIHDRQSMASTLPGAVIVLNPDVPGIDRNLFRRALHDTVSEYVREVRTATGEVSYQTVMRDEEEAQRLHHDWSCRLAQALDQDYLQHYRLRIFDSPEILGAYHAQTRECL